MLVNHELDAAAINSPWKNMPNVIGRSHRIPGADGDWSKVKLLFSDRMAEGKRFFQKWGFLPVNRLHGPWRDSQEVSLGRVQSLHRFRKSQDRVQCKTTGQHSVRAVFR